MCIFRADKRVSTTQVSSKEPVIGYKVLTRSYANPNGQQWVSPLRLTRWRNDRMTAVKPIGPETQRGIYAFKSRDSARRYLTSYGTAGSRVVKVALHGEVQEFSVARGYNDHPAGYMAQHARIIDPPPSGLRRRD